MCYWCIIKDSWKTQHHRKHMDYKDTKSCRETPGTNTRNGQVQMEHPWTLSKVPEGSGEQGKTEKTGCEIICGAPTTLAVKG